MKTQRRTAPKHASRRSTGLEEDGSERREDPVATRWRSKGQLIDAPPTSPRARMPAPLNVARSHIKDVRVKIIKARPLKVAEDTATAKSRRNSQRTSSTHTLHTATRRPDAQAGTEVTQDTRGSRPLHSAEVTQDTRGSRPLHSAGFTQDTWGSRPHHSAEFTQDTWGSRPHHSAEVTQDTWGLRPHHSAEFTQDTRGSRSQHSAEVTQDTGGLRPHHSAEFTQDTWGSRPHHSAEVTQDMWGSRTHHSAEVTQDTRGSCPHHSAEVTQDTWGSLPHHSAEFTQDPVAACSRRMARFTHHVQDRAGAAWEAAGDGQRRVHEREIASRGMSTLRGPTASAADGDCAERLGDVAPSVAPWCLGTCNSAEQGCPRSCLPSPRVAGCACCAPHGGSLSCRADLFFPMLPLWPCYPQL
ncbi:uncharacterized protein LOC133355618 isoform X2 [Lethenteron reissneri]|uniref:uncharacterized protein LOC133355618 isoform X2 n=1 Tax=Lethenteron reissneri TaxID=7753 RepID=UPI002AB6DEDF|nr:uncharacterized protein LOC133355618 isoform X2 [Lethenteron reissneri]